MKVLCIIIGYTITGLAMALTQWFVMKSEIKRNTYCAKCGKMFTFENPKELVDIKGKWHCKECSKFIKGGGDNE